MNTQAFKWLINKSLKIGSVRLSTYSWLTSEIKNSDCFSCLLTLQVDDPYLITLCMPSWKYTIKNVIIKDKFFRANQVLTILSEHCNLITTLEFEGPEFSNSLAMHNWTETLPVAQPLMQLEVFKCYDHLMDARFINRLFIISPQLLSVHLSSWNNVDDDIMITLSMNCSNLKQFIVQSEFMGISRLSDLSMISFFQGCKQLEKVGIGSSPNLEDNIIIEMASNCHNLKYVDINNCSKLTEKGITEIAKKCLKLEKIILHNTIITNDIIQLIFLNCQCLRSICIQRSTYTEENKSDISSFASIRLLAKQYPHVAIIHPAITGYENIVFELGLNNK
eukprot:gene5578-7703_t